MVEILDSTLREGEQTPGVTFSVEEKITIASLLDEFGVDIIEAGHPRVSDDICRGVKEISNQGYKAEILAHCRAIKEDIDFARSCDVDWVGIFFCVSNQRLEQQFRSNLNRAINLITSTIEYAKEHGLKVRYTPEDATRTEYASLTKVSKAAIEAGADRISIADTVGAMTPIKMYEFVNKLKSDLKIKLNVHCHNDLGLATANSLAAYEAGATMIDVTVNGMGERVGITSLTELCIALHFIYKTKNNWKLDMLPELSHKVSEFSGMNISPNTPIVGKNAFLHNAGLHVAAVLNNPKHYEIFPAEIVGRKRSFVLDKMAGKQTIKQKLEQMKIAVCDNNITKIIHYVKSKEKGTVSDSEIMGILDNSEIQMPIFQ
ncbi:MAG: homocitrate synthase [Thermoplasmatales archaeon]|nr:MAG: homocitrate synthase [Thermoplasmatales archaeon]